MRKKNTLLQLFLNMLYISAFTFGGGFVIITLMKRKFCDELGRRRRCWTSRRWPSPRRGPSR